MHGPAEQEKGLVLSFVNLWYPDGTADEAGELVITEGRVAEIEICPVEHIVIHIAILALEVKPVGPRLVGCAEHAAGGMPELGGKDGGCELYFLNRVRRARYDPVSSDSTYDRLRSGNAVQAISKPAIALSVDVESVHARHVGHQIHGHPRIALHDRQGVHL